MCKKEAVNKWLKNLHIRRENIQVKITFKRQNVVLLNWKKELKNKMIKIIIMTKLILNYKKIIKNKMKMLLRKIIIILKIKFKNKIIWSYILIQILIKTTKSLLSTLHSKFRSLICHNFEY